MSNRKWVNKFQKLCYKCNRRNVAKAIQLKNRNTPSKLYQYRSINTNDQRERLGWVLDVIKTGELFCSSNANLNDPLDMQSVLSTREASSYIYSISSAMGNRDFASTYTAIKLFTPFLKRKWRKNGLTPDEIAAFDTAINDIVMKLTEDLQEQHSEIMGLARVVCFTEKYDNLPMWWFYADERRGVCLEFDVEALSSEKKFFVFPVKYVDKLFNAVEEAYKLDTRRINNMDKRDRDFFMLLCSFLLPCTNKLSDWSYESEWRYVMIKQDKFNFVKPSKIILGDKIDGKNQDVLVEVAKCLKIVVTKMEITKYGLQEEEIN